MMNLEESKAIIELFFTLGHSRSRSPNYQYPFPCEIPKFVNDGVLRHLIFHWKLPVGYSFPDPRSFSEADSDG